MVKLCAISEALNLHSYYCERFTVRLVPPTRVGQDVCHFKCYNWAMILVSTHRRCIVSFLKNQAVYFSENQQYFLHEDLTCDLSVTIIF